MIKRTVFRGIGIVLLLVVLLIAVFFLSGGRIGMTESKTAEDLRTAQNLPDDWLITGNVTDTAVLYLFYPPDKHCYGYALYVNEPGLSFGYVFRGSATVSDIQGSQEALSTPIQELSVAESGQTAYFSLNPAQLDHLTIDNGASVETWELDSSIPFVHLFPQNGGVVTFYDADGNIIEPQPAHL